MVASLFLLIMAFVLSAFACFVVIKCNEPIVKEISDRKIVRSIINIIYGALTFMVTFSSCLRCFFGK